MSLDVYLSLPGPGHSQPIERIYIREGGATREISRAEWDALYPGVEPVVAVDQPDPDADAHDVFTANITHNLAAMARECGLYQPLWAPDVERARDLVEPLRAGLRALIDDPERFQAFNPSNGWGDYDLLVRFTENYLAACLRWPDASVRVWR